MGLARAAVVWRVQVGAQGKKQLRGDADVFSAGSRELALIPGLENPPTHYHSEIAEVDPSAAVGDTHAEKGGSHLRFREFILFRPTLLYPEYLVAYRRVP